MNLPARALFASFLLLLGSCATTPPPEVTAQTLEGNPHLPASEIAGLCSAEQWKILRAQTYRGYVIMNLGILEDGSVSIGGVKACFPDALHLPLARALAKTVRLPGVTTVGSHLPASGELYVVIFDAGLNGKQVLVYARQVVEAQSGAQILDKAKYISMEAY